MKQIIQILCYNQSGTLPITLRKLHRVSPGIEPIKYLVVDNVRSDCNRYIFWVCKPPPKNVENLWIRNLAPFGRNSSTTHVI